MFAVRSACFDPFAEDGDLRSLERLVGVGWWHDLVRIRVENALHEGAGIGISRNHGRDAFMGGLGGRFVVEAEPGFALVGIGPVAEKTVARENRAHVAIEVDCGGTADGQEEEKDAHVADCNSADGVGNSACGILNGAILRVCPFPLHFSGFHMISRILTHPGGAHKDDFLACCVLAAQHGVPIERREPTAADLDDLSTCVVDVGDEHAPGRNNFDHHQFPRDHEPICALSLVLQHLGVYEDAKQFCAWMEPAEWFDSRGPVRTAQWLGVERDIVTKLSSPIDVCLLRRFASATRVEPGTTLYELMCWVGADLMEYLRNLREQLAFVSKHVELWTIPAGDSEFRVAFMPRTEPVVNDPSSSLARYVSVEVEGEVVGLVYPDRRGGGYGLSRLNDDLRLDFTQIDSCEDVHFAHASGFVAKTSAADPARLRELAAKAWAG
ncbi:MAG: hypothetical protein ACI8W8_005087 [Rhodothermales bacterium]